MEALKVIDPSLLGLPPEQVATLWPYIWLLGGAVLAMVVGVMKSFPTKWPVFGISIASIVAAIIASGKGISAERIELFGGMMVSDGFSSFFNILFLACAGLSILASM